jgi:hypothetical protein
MERCGRLGSRQSLLLSFRGRVVDKGGPHAGHTGLRAVTAYDETRLCRFVSIFPALLEDETRRG